MNKALMKHMLQSLEVMEQNFINQARALRGMLLSLDESLDTAPAPIKLAKKEAEKNAEKELESYFREIAEGVTFERASNGDVPES